LKFLQHKKILLISPEAWGKSKVSKHHYAIIAGKFGNKVWFLQPSNAFNSIAEPIPQHITLVEDRYRFRGLRRLPTLLRKLIFKRLIKKMESDLQTQFDVVWNFDNSRFYDLDCFDAELTIHHCMDYHYHFQFERASRSADICFGVTDGIVENLKKYNPNSFFIHHGYQEVIGSTYSLMPSTQKLRAVFVGNFMRKDIAWNWLHQVTTQFDNIHFYFVGNYGISNLSQTIDPDITKQIEEISQHPNVTFMGELNESDSWSAICQSDILFAAFRADRYPEIFANLHKIMTYLATGKPIVINRIMQFESTPNLLLMAYSEDEFIAHFKLLSTKPETQFGEFARKNRIEFAYNNTYEKQFARIDQLISTKYT
jgi:hypothetical protein